LFCIGELSLHAKQSFGKGAVHFISYDELENSLLDSLTEDTTLLVKGSRYMQMDRVVNSLVEEQK
jgi:UDP-N-acetylmuramoyl-tripeptide--D-alanyl-D-alanine ligase